MDILELLGHLNLVPGVTGPAREAPTFGGGPNPNGSISLVGQPTSTPAVQPSGEAPEQDLGAVMSPHQFRGMFGLHGTMRDVLGALGDAFLTQGGAHPVYAPRQQQEREANAMQHLQDNPMQAVQALSRVNPDAAREMYHNLIRDNAYSAEQVSQEATRAQTTQDRARAAFSSLGGAANERTWPAIRARLQQMAVRNNIDIPAELLPEQYSDDVPEALIRFGTPPGTQMTADNNVDYRTSRLAQIDAALAERRGYHHDLVGLGGRRADIAEEGVGVARDRVGVARQGVDVQRGGLAERERHNRWDEAHPSRSRRAAPGGPPPQMQEGGRYREHGTGRIYHVSNGQKVYE